MMSLLVQLFKRGIHQHPFSSTPVGFTDAGFMESVV